MTTVKEIYDLIDSVAPFASAEDFDNVGLLIGDFSQPVSRVMIALDGTEEVLRQAIDVGAELLVTHHPILFHPVKQLLQDSLPYQFVKSGISVISAHTNLDKAPGGVGDALARALQLTEIEEIPGTAGMGRVGTLPRPMSDAVFSKWVENQLNTKVRYTPVHHEIRRAAVLGGAGDFALSAVADIGADAFVTGESKHHILLEAISRQISYVDAGHYSTEAVVCPVVAQWISEAFSSLTVLSAKQSAPFVGGR